jgi:probable rRNA maturation factor
LEINFFFPDKRYLELNKKWIVKRFEKIAFFEKYKINLVNFIFVSDRTIVIQNRKFLNHFYPTDIITFDYSNHHSLSGDIYISYDMVLYNSRRFNVTFKEELKRVMIHGLLHLMNYKDKSKIEKVVMRKKENYYLRCLKNG